jgi:hypothetical protein
LLFLTHSTKIVEVFRPGTPISFQQKPNKEETDKTPKGNFKSQKMKVWTGLRTQNSYNNQNKKFIAEEHVEYSANFQSI